MLLIEPLTGKIIEANTAASYFYGYSKEELLNMGIQDINTVAIDDSINLYEYFIKRTEIFYIFAPHEKR